ncbi:MAG: glycosyltransferase family 4 protein, partial [Proteobacteria bacterium]|nr:glycosyltransferase family 4 protein [Pseudomonadota bacterium]
MPNPFRIGFVSTSFPRYDGDVAGNFVFGLAREFSRRGYDVEVVAPEPSSRDDWRGGPCWLEGVRVFSAAYIRPRNLQQLFYEAGVPDNLTKNPLLAGLIPTALASLFAVSLRRARKWNAAISHWLVPSALITGMACSQKTRHLAIAHSTDVYLLRQFPLGRWLARAVLRSADHLGFVSHELRDEFLSLLDPRVSRDVRGRLSITPMGIDPNTLISEKSREAVRFELGLSGFMVLFIGRLVPIKGVDVLIEAVKNLEGLELVIAGDGPERAMLETQALKLGINVRFLGWIDPLKRAELLSACDAVAIPSLVLTNGRHEGLPLTLIEALRAGCPVIATASGATEELIEDGISGLVVPPNNSPALRDAIERLKREPDLIEKLSRAGRERAQDRDWERLAPLYENLI